MGARMRAHDWAASPLGPAETWPPALKTAIRLILNTGHPMYVWWGPDLLCFYNDAYSRSLGPERHPGSLGQPGREVWAEIWPLIGHQVDFVMAGLGSTWDENRQVPITRFGRLDEIYWTYSYSPIDDQTGPNGVGGVLVVCTETTESVLAERRLTEETQRQRRLFEQAPGFIAILSGPDHVFEFVNESYDRHFDRRGFVGRRVRDVFPELKGQGFFELLDRVYATGERFVASAMPVQLKAGPGAQPVEHLLDFIYEPVRAVDGSVTGIFVEGYDVTERSRAEAGLRTAEERYLALFNAIDQGFCTIELKFDEADRPVDYRFLEVSQSFERQTGITQAAGRWMREIEPDQDQHWFDTYGRVARTGEPVRFVNFSTPLGRWFEVYAFRISGPHRIAVLFRDITEQKRTEAALRESEDRFRDMADRAPVMMWVTDPSGHCTHLNARWYEFTGQPPGAGEGYGWLDAVHPDDRALAEQAFIDANAERRDYQVDFRLRRADGVYRWTLDTAAARSGANGEYLGYVGSVIDIDERREAEERLALSEERLRLALDVGEIGQWHVDLPTSEMFWPPRVKAMFGISADVPVTLNDFLDNVHPDDREKTRAAFAAASDPDRRPIYDVEYRTIGKEDGVLRWVAARGRGLFTPDGVCHRIIGTAIDITARKAAEVRLHELNERLEQEVAKQTAARNRVWEMSRDLFAIMGFDGQLKVINPAWEATLGRDAATLLSLSFREQVHPEDHAAVEAVMERLLRGETVERFEDRLLHADGSWRWISWTLVPEGDAFYAVGRDVTQEKTAAAELGRTQEALRQSHKMEAMGQLTGGVAHDFNNLLTPIIGGLDMLQRRRIGEEREHRIIDGALQSAERAKTLVQRLLAFARRQPLQSAAVDMTTLVAGMADLVASTTGPQIKVVVESEPGLPPAQADANQLEMALLNLAVNARDAMMEGGILRISAARETVSGKHHAGLTPGDYIRISVADTGVGMDEATVARAVEPFFSTKGVGKGTGLGLSMVHGLAMQLGGGLAIHSKRGLGTNVEVWIPVSHTAVAMGVAPHGIGVLPTGRGTVLLVDDEVLVRASTAEMLMELGYTVTEAPSAESALDILRSGLRPDILVTDHLMSGMTGVQLAREARALQPNLPVLIVSGYAEQEGVAPDLPRLTKPFRNLELAASLAAL